MAAEMVLLNIDQLRRGPVDRAPSRSSGGIFELWKKHSIYRIPAYMKDQNPKAYTLQLVSIGPYHHGASHLAAMEEHKARSLQQFLDRTNQPFEAYRDALRPLTSVLVESYQQLDDEWRIDTERFLLLMVVDGSFLCEFLHGCSNGWDYDLKDPVFSFDALLNTCRHIIPDVLMMENQIPFVLIERLIAVQTGQLNEKDVFFDPYSELCEVRDLLNEYYAKKMKNMRRRLREWGRNLMQTYFDNPWTILSLLAATLLLVLTLLQTICTMKGSYGIIILIYIAKITRYWFFAVHVLHCQGSVI